jgi:hypothetical protein
MYLAGGRALVRRYPRTFLKKIKKKIVEGIYHACVSLFGFRKIEFFKFLLVSKIPSIKDGYA